MRAALAARIVACLARATAPLAADDHPVGPAMVKYREPEVAGGYRKVTAGETTDQLRTTTVELSALQRSTMDTSDKWFTLDNRGGPIWGSRGREFKSRQPDRTPSHHRT
jgi:hypothetical protein